MPNMYKGFRTLSDWIPPGRLSRSTGFTTLELLVAATVVLLLAGLVVSLAQLHIIRHQVTSAVATAEPLKARMAEFFAQVGEWPVSRQDLGLQIDPAASRSSYVQGIEIDHEMIELRFGRRAHASIAGTHLVLRAVPEDGQFVWRCYPEPAEHHTDGVSTGYDLPARHRPADCR